MAVFTLRLTELLHILFHHLEGLAMDSRDGNAHATDIHDKATVAVDADNIALKTGKGTGNETQFDVATGIILERMKQETNALWRCLHHTHERAHDAIRDDGRKMGAAIIHEIMAGKVCIKIILQFLRRTLQEHKAADGRLLYCLNATGMLAALVNYSLMHEMAHIIPGKLLRKYVYLAVMNEKIAPFCLQRLHILHIRTGIFLYHRTGILRLGNIDALWNTNLCLEYYFRHYYLMRFVS